MRGTIGFLTIHLVSLVSCQNDLRGIIPDTKTHVAVLYAEKRRSVPVDFKSPIIETPDGQASYAVLDLHAPTKGLPKGFEGNECLSIAIAPGDEGRVVSWSFIPHTDDETADLSAFAKGSIRLTVQGPPGSALTLAIETGFGKPAGGFSGKREVFLDGTVQRIAIPIGEFFPLLSPIALKDADKPEFAKTTMLLDVSTFAVTKTVLRFDDIFWTAAPASGPVNRYERESMLLYPEGAPDSAGTGAEDNPVMTPFVPAGDGPFPAVIVCPGGSYWARAPQEGGSIAQWLCANRIAGLVLHYRVRPYDMVVSYRDADRAIRLARMEAKRLSIDPARVGIMGFSAGGHLAIAASTFWDMGSPAADDPIMRLSSRPDLMVTAYPVFSDMSNLAMPVDLAAEEGTMMFRLVHLDRFIAATNPPAFLWHTAEDRGVQPTQSTSLARVLAANGVPYELHVYPSGPHGTALANEWPENTWKNDVLEWMNRLRFLR